MKLTYEVMKSSPLLKEMTVMLRTIPIRDLKKPNLSNVQREPIYYIKMAMVIWFLVPHSTDPDINRVG